jgi:hypothetical protein
MIQIIYEIVSGTPNFTVSINPFVSPDQVQTSVGVYSFDNIPAQDYLITITDGNGCVIYLQYTLSSCILQGDIDCLTTTTSTTGTDCSLEGDIDCFTTTSTTSSTSSTTTTTSSSSTTTTTTTIGE